MACVSVVRGCVSVNSTAAAAAAAAVAGATTDIARRTSAAATPAFSYAGRVCSPPAAERRRHVATSMERIVEHLHHWLLEGMAPAAPRSSPHPAPSHHHTLCCATTAAGHSLCQTDVVNWRLIYRLFPAASRMLAERELWLC